MTTDTEALRQKFERHIVATGRSEGELIFEAGHYLYPDVQEIWELYQAGYAAAKAETADPVVGRWYFVANDGAATLCVDEADARESAAEAREKCAGIVNELRMECARRNMPESATMLWHAKDAIRAGAKA